MSRARAFMDALEDKKALVQLMRPEGEGITVRIGEETGMMELSDCSVITAPYRVGRGYLGSIGIIGPTRMNYARTIETLDMLAQELTDILSVSGT